MLVASFLCSAASSSAHSFSYAPFIDAWMENLALSRSVISSFWTVAMLASAALMPFAGSLIDRKGARCVLMCCTPLSVGVTIWLGLVSTPVELCAAITVNRIVSADVLNLLSQTTLSRWFVRYRGRAATTLGVANAWFLEFPALEIHLQHALGRSSSVYAAIASYVAVLCLTCIAVWRDTPETVGLLPDLAHPEPGPSQVEDGAPLQPPAAEKPGGSAEDVAEASYTRAEAMRTVLFWAVAMMQFNSAALWVAIHFNLIDILASKGTPRDAAASFYNAVSATRLVVSLLLNFLVVDRLGRRTYLLLAASAFPQLAIIALVLGFIGPQVWPAWMAVAFGLIYGCWGGVNSCVNNVVFAQLFGRAHIGAIAGFAKAFMLTAGGGGPLWFSIVKDATGSYAPALYCVLVSTLVFNVALCSAPMPQQAVPQSRSLALPSIRLGRPAAYKTVMDNSAVEDEET